MIGRDWDDTNTYARHDTGKAVTRYAFCIVCGHQREVGFGGVSCYKCCGEIVRLADLSEADLEEMTRDNLTVAQLCERYRPDNPLGFRNIVSGRVSCKTPNKSNTPKGRPPKLREKYYDKVIGLIKCNPTLSMQQVADHFGISQTTVSRWFEESGLKKWFA